MWTKGQRQQQTPKSCHEPSKHGGPLEVFKGRITMAWPVFEKQKAQICFGTKLQLLDHELSHRCSSGWPHPQWCLNKNAALNFKGKTWFEEYAWFASKLDSQAQLTQVGWDGMLCANRCRSSNCSHKQTVWTWNGWWNTEQSNCLKSSSSSLSEHRYCRRRALTVSKAKFSALGVILIRELHDHLLQATELFDVLPESLQDKHICSCCPAAVPTLCQMHFLAERQHVS